jgi:sodium/proline symporter
MNWTIITFIIYSVVVFGIVIYVGRKYVTNIHDFFIGGRRVGWLGTGVSYMASARSASSILGDSGLAYIMGYPTIFLGIGMTLVEFFNMLYTGPRMRRYALKYDCITIPDYLESRFGDNTKVLRLLTIIVITVFFIAYIAAQIVGTSLAFTTMFSWSAAVGMIVATVIVIIYCIIGGYVAVVWTDVFQGLLMIVAFIILPITMIVEAGGVTSIFTKLAAIDKKLVTPFGQGLPFFLLVTFLAVGSLGNPHLLIRFMSARSSDALRQGALVSLVGNIIMRWGAIFTGLAGRALWPQVSELIAGNRETVFFTGAVNLLPTVITGLLVAAVMAAVMSTVDSQLILLASAVTRDFYGKILGKEKMLSEKKYLLISRGTILVTGLLSLGFAFYSQAGVFSIVRFAWAGLGAAFGPVIIISLFWKKMTRAGAISGILSAFIVTIVWRLVPSLVAKLYEGVPAVITATVLVVVVSLLTRQDDPERIEKDFSEIAPKYLR